MSNIKNELQIALIHAMKRFLSTKNGHMLWSVTLMSVREDTAAARLFVSGYEEMIGRFDLSAADLPKMSAVMEKGLQNDNHHATMEGDLSMATSFLIKLTNRSGRVWEIESVVLDEIGRASMNTTSISASSVSLNPLIADASSYEQVIAEDVSRKLDRRLQKAVGQTIETERVFIAEADIEHINGIVADIRFVTGTLEDELLPYISRVRAVELLKKRNEEGTGFVYTDVTRKISEIIEEVKPVIERIKRESMKFRSADLRQSLGTSTMGHLIGLPNVLRHMEGRNETVQSSFMQLRNDMLEETKIQLCNSCETDSWIIIDSLDEVADVYRVFTEQ